MEEGEKGGKRGKERERDESRRGVRARDQGEAERKKQERRSTDE